LELNQQTKKKSGKKRRRSRRRRKPNPDYIPSPSGPTEPGSGVLDVANDGSGTLRSDENNFLPWRRRHLRAARPDQDALAPGGFDDRRADRRAQEARARSLCSARSTRSMALTPDERKELDPFGKLTVVDPEPQLVLEPGQGDDGDVSLRVIDLLAPVGKGQRGLIVAPPRSGKTVLLQKISKALSTSTTPTVT
jgi:transcription termination factor Rho